MVSKTRLFGRRLALAALLVMLVLTAAGTASAQDGKSVYDSSCSSCHAPDGTGLLKGQPDFTDPATWEGLTMEDVVSFVEAGGNMPGLGGEGDGMAADGGASLSEEERAAVVDYIMGLPEAGGGEEHADRAMPDTTLTLTEELPPHEIGLVNFLVLLLVMGLMFGVNRLLSEG